MGVPIRNHPCCSTVHASIVFGVYIAVVYLVAFAMELVFVLEGEKRINSGKETGPLPSAAYILVFIYFSYVGLSVMMINTLYQKRITVLLVWIYTFFVIFTPEFGIVLYLYVFHWGYYNMYGIIELLFYFFRIPTNVICAMCVYSVYSEWKGQQSTEKTLKKLSDLQMMKDASGQTLSYKNEGFYKSQTDLATLHSLPLEKYADGITGPYISKLNSLGKNEKINASTLSLNVMDKQVGMARKYSSASQYAEYRPIYPRSQYDVLPGHLTGGWDTPTYHQNLVHDSASEFNASLFTDHSKLGSMPIISHSRSERTIYQPPSYPPNYRMEPILSPLYGGYPINQGYAPSHNFYNTMPNARDYWNTDYRRSMIARDCVSLSLDRQRSLRRTKSFSADPYNMLHGGLPSQFGYYGYPVSRFSKISLGAESDDFRKYRDVAL